MCSFVVCDDKNMPTLRWNHNLKASKSRQRANYVDFFFVTLQSYNLVNMYSLKEAWRLCHGEELMEGSDGNISSRSK